nr:hypothetical protein [Tanacetum cinerariifolium]
MLLKQKDPMMSKKKVNTKPVDYAVLNQLSQDFETRFISQTELSAEQVFWSQNSVNSKEPNPSTRPTQVKVPKELPKVSMVNTSLKKLQHHLASFDVKAQQLEPKLYDGNVIQKTNAIVIHDTEETLMLAEESSSKMLLKQKDPMITSKRKKSLMQTVTLLKNDFKKEESKNIDIKIVLEKKIKLLDNILFKRDQSTQTVHMLTKPQSFYDRSTKHALGFQNHFYLKKARQLEPKLYDGDVIKNNSAIVILDSEETLMLAEESHPIPSNRPTTVEVPSELPKVSMVNTSLQKLKRHLAGFDVVVKERTTTTSITEGS